MNMNEKNISADTKRPYQKPEIKDHGSVEKITEQPFMLPSISMQSIVSNNA